MAKQKGVVVLGKVIKSHANAMFDVILNNDSVVKCHVSGKIRTHNIKILEEDMVEIEFSPYDLTRARIIQRRKV
jgi:translation initiation factor IF-1